MKQWDVLAVSRGLELSEALTEGWEPFAVCGNPPKFYMRKLTDEDAIPRKDSDT